MFHLTRNWVVNNQPNISIFASTFQKYLLIQTFPPHNHNKVHVLFTVGKTLQIELGIDLYPVITQQICFVPTATLISQKINIYGLITQDYITSLGYLQCRPFLVVFFRIVCLSASKYKKYKCIVQIFESEFFKYQYDSHEN